MKELLSVIEVQDRLEVAVSDIVLLQSVKEVNIEASRVWRW